ncbi:fibronectin type III domain-containing protein [Streptomyces sp. NPDC090052]|uniref:virginiamycin B lyase family protein n=1 Tax=unclassified Streptomyces TaxID=2593676 RepID=UPI002B1DE51E|nr:fibronectin type III domain-containing protein [Streptomyces sp. NBC_01306]
MTATAGILLLCTAGLGSAHSAEAAVTAAPAPGSAPLYVSDYTAGKVLRLAADGGSQTEVPATGLTRPTGMTLDAAGNLYIADTGDNRVVRVPAGGGPQTDVPTTDLNRPIGLALDRAGDLFIADSFNDRVVEVPADGGPQRTVPTTGLLHPSGLALDAADNLYVADFSNDRVVEVPADGSGQTTVPAVGLSQPTGLAFDTRGALYIADSGNDRVVKLPARGRRQVTVPTTGLRGPQGLALDGARNLFVADFGNDRVIEVPADGRRQTTVPFTGLSTPAGVAVPPSPAPPTNVRAVPGFGRATVSFAGSVSPSVSRYTVTAIDLTRSSHGVRTAPGRDTRITVTGLTPGDTYRFTVTATNAAGATSRASARSEAVTILPAARRIATRLRAEPATAVQHPRPPVLRVKGLSATLTRADGVPVTGRTVAFTNTARTRKLCSAVTDRKGVARCDATVRDRTRGAGGLAADLRCHGYLATFAGTAAYRPSKDTAPVRFEHRR